MRKLNINLKDRKVLTLGLCLILVCVFTLTIAYAALNAVLTISGSAQVTSANWDIHLANPKVTNGSATTAVPSITSGKTLNFSTTLTTPGDFYEFTVDVVNGGSIDAMIESVIKTPELTSEQAKYLKYEVSYANGESINDNQIIASGVTMPIKVRVEYRKDLVASDLPSGTVQLTLGLVLEYIQSDGTGTTVNNNGVAAKLVSANGDINVPGTIVSIGDQQFYTIGTEGDNVKLLSMFNLYVGGEYNNGWTSYGDEATGKQDQNMLGWVSGQSIKGTTEFSNDMQSGKNHSDYSGSIVVRYVNNYKTILESNYGVDVVEARLISYEELTDSETFACVDYDYCSDKYPWIYSTSYWSGSADDAYDVWRVDSDGNFGSSSYYDGDSFGVRPVIIVSKAQIIVEEKRMIEFTVSGVTYEAEEGMTWRDWAFSSYCPIDHSSTNTPYSESEFFTPSGFPYLLNGQSVSILAVINPGDALETNSGPF